MFVQNRLSKGNTDLCMYKLGPEHAMFLLFFKHSTNFSHDILYCYGAIVNVSNVFLDLEIISLTFRRQIELNNTEDGILLLQNLTYTKQ